MEKINQLGHRRLVLAILLVAIVSITFAAFFALRSSGAAAECRALASEPSRDTSHLANVHSDDLDALATLSGSLELAATLGQSRYLPLDLQEVSLETVNKTSRLLVLDTTCARLLLDLSLSYEIWSVNSIEAIPSQAILPAADGAEFYSCKFPVKNMRFESDEGLTCSGRQSLKCPTPQGGRHLFLHTNLVRFELGGNPQDVARGEYSRPSRECDPPSRGS